MKSAVFYAIPFFFILMAIDFFYGRWKQKPAYSLRDSITNISIGIGSQAFGVFFTFFLVGIYMWFYNTFGFFKESLTVSPLNAILALIGFDFFYYWAHRFSHEWNFLWAAHVVHHSSEEYNLSVALRQSWIHSLLAFFIFLPMPVLGFEPTIFFAAGGVVTLYQFWVHTKSIDRMPRWFEYIFNTPSHHRVHHGVNPKYIDRNHAAVFIIWDRIFGTFQVEEEEPTYGITTPIKSWNPVWANLHYWVEMYKLARQCNKWSDKIRVIFARPGWRPEEQGGQLEIPEVNKSSYKKFDTEPEEGLQFYAIFQFLAVLIGIVAFLGNFHEISEFYRWFFLANIILTILICGALLEKKRWVIAAEYLRLFLVLISLNSFYYFWYMDWFSIMIGSSLVLVSASVIFFTLSWRKIELGG
jgi:alkylglycerol monooxygenase